MRKTILILLIAMLGSALTTQANNGYKKHKRQKAKHYKKIYKHTNKCFFKN